MRLFFIIAFCLFVSIAKPQQSAPAKKVFEKQLKHTVNDTIEIDDYFICILEIEARIDEKQWQDYLKRSLELDSLSVDTIPAGIYKVIAQFVIDTAGKISEVKIVDNPGYDLGKRVMKSLFAFTGKWTPAERNGRKVKNYRRQDITFIVDEEEYCNELPKKLML